MKNFKLIFLLVFVLQQIGLSQNILGIDVSKWQGDIDWELIHAQGKVFAYIKATEGMTYTDPFFIKNVEGGIQAGVIVGAYHFARPDNNTALEDANNYLSQAHVCVGSNFLPPALDLENPNSSTNITNLFTSKELSEWVQEWCEKVEEKTGIRPIIYTNSYIANYLQDELNKYGLWIAKPNTPPSTPPSNIGIWNDWNIKQYSWEGNILGINGNVDLNIYNGSIDNFKDFINAESVTISSQTQSKGIILYPNPTNGNIRIHSNSLKINKIVLYNSIGQEVQQIDKPKRMLEINHLTAGVYYVKILLWNGQISHKIIKKL